MDKIYDIIILGGGPAGYTAALYTARAGLETLVIEKMSAGGQMTLTDTIDNYPGFPDGVDGFTLGMQMQQGAEKYGAVTVYDEITAVDFNDKTKKIHTSSGTYNAKAVIIATGANPRELGLAEESALIGKGVHYCAHCDGRFYKDKTIVVAGGGNSAAADALYLSRIAKKVYIVHRRDTLRATKIYHTPLTQAENIEFVWNSNITKIISDGKVTGIEITDKISGETSRYDCDAVFVSIGRKPATEFLKNILPLDENGYIIADESTKTDIDGVFAAGDVRTKTLRQIVTAVSDGATAAHFAEEFISTI